MFESSSVLIHICTSKQDMLFIRLKKKTSRFCEEAIYSPMPNAGDGDDVAATAIIAMLSVLGLLASFAP